MSLSIPYGELEQKYEELKEAVERVRELHKPVVMYTNQTFCDHCWDEDLQMYYKYPCPTIKELDGETNEHSK